VNNGPVAEGSTGATVSIGSASDPAQADVTAGFSYAYDFDNDGVLDTAFTLGASSVAVPGSLVLDDGLQTIRAIIRDKDLGQTELFTELQITNAAPSLLAAGLGSVAEGSPYTLNLSATDPGADSVLEWIVDWNDGVVETYAGAAVVAGHTFADNEPTPWSGRWTTTASGPPARRST
jgi:hypothetical protein